MAVNFETPDPGIIERPYVEQIPLEALFKNLSYKQAQYDQGIQQARRTLDTLNNIKSFGHDTDVKNDMFQRLNQELSKFNGANFGDSNVQMQLDGIVNSFTSTKELAGIHARGIALEKMDKEAHDARMKGQEYYNPGYDAALKYYNEGVYSADARFRDEGNIAPDFSKLREDVLKMPQVTYKKSTTDDQGHVITYDVVDPEKAAAAYMETMERDPKFAKYTQYKFESQHPGVDWQKEGKAHFAGRAKYFDELAYNERYAASAEKNPSTAAYHLKAAEEAESQRDQYQAVLAGSETVGVDFKGAWFDDFKRQEASSFGRSKALISASKYDTDATYLENLKHANTLKELERKNFYDRGIDPKTGEKLPYNPAAIKSGRNAELTQAEELHFGDMLRKKYQVMVDEKDVRATQTGNALVDFYLSDPNNKVNKEGDTWYVTNAKDNSKHIVLTEDRFVDKYLKGSKLQMIQMTKDIEAQTAGKKPGASTPAP